MNLIFSQAYKTGPELGTAQPQLVLHYCLFCNNFLNDIVNGPVSGLFKETHEYAGLGHHPEEAIGKIGIRFIKTWGKY